MSEPGSIHALEDALLARAKALADEYIAHGREAQILILDETNARLRRCEEQETQLAESLAERLYKQRVQAGELIMRAELDHLRWTWVQSILAKVKAYLARLAEDEVNYLPILAQLFKQAAEAIERDELVARVNTADMERLGGRWGDWAGPLLPGKHVILSTKPIDCLGGILVQSRDERIRFDNTFEGRMERLQDELQRVILERLSAAIISNAAWGTSAGMFDASLLT